ncbi:MAG: hypothetical protein AAF806_00620 [Bacteroidota bacterium]
MKQTLLLLLALFFLCSTHAQKETQKFAFGLQSGVNFTYNQLPESDYLQGDLFLGNALGVVARSYLTRYKQKWGPFTNWVNVYVDYGLMYHYRGYNYSAGNSSVLREKIRASLPVMLVLRADNKYFNRNWKRNKRYFIVRNGIQLDFNFNPITAASVSTPNFSVQEFNDLGRTNIYYVGGFGIQQYAKKNASFAYVGISYYASVGQKVSGTFDIIDNNTIAVKDQLTFRRLGSYFSLDCQYFFDLKKRVKIEDRTIYNPRYL